MDVKKVIEIMYELDEYAKTNTTDPSIYVGAAVGNIIHTTDNKGQPDQEFEVIGMGCNQNLSYNEKSMGFTYREFLFGSRDAKYRPWDKIIHAEENAIIDAIHMHNRTEFGVHNYTQPKLTAAIVTRYPCEKCAQLMVYKGISTVFYGRSFKISDDTQKIFDDNGVQVIHVSQYQGPADDVNGNASTSPSGGKN